MNKEYVWIVLFLGMMLLASCGVAERGVSPAASPERPRSSPSPAAVIVSASSVQQSLQEVYETWQGTPYRLGGTSPRGVDCSAFMKIIFDRQFGLQLPRNTRSQLYAGSPVRRNSLQTGDLVFFKTGRKTLHVGVIMNSPNFLHASTSQGVTISTLDAAYWSSRYLQARRVLGR